MTLPPEVLKLLGEDATPEKAEAVFAERSVTFERAVPAWVADGHEIAEISPDRVARWWQNALAAAAIRAMEARVHYLAASAGSMESSIRAADLCAAEDAYYAIRNRRTAHA